MKIRFKLGWLSLEVEGTIDELIDFIDKLTKLFPNIIPKEVN